MFLYINRIVHSPYLNLKYEILNITSGVVILQILDLIVNYKTLL